jgi:ABC-2 type transport system permease protein
VSLSQVWLVVRQEFRIRLRTGRWRWLMGLWVLLLLAVTLLLDATLYTGYGPNRDDTMRGVPLFGFLMYFILGMMLVISPALTSQTINGDRERGTLATLQVTRLRPLEIALGKLVAGWAVGLVSLALSLPFAGFAMSKGGITVGRIAATYGVVALLIGVICAVSQALSALLARSITSALLSYLTVAALSVGTVIAFGLIAPLMREEVYVKPPGDPVGYYTTLTHQERVWWLVAPNPFVVLADSAPRVPPRIVRGEDYYYTEDYDPLSQISNSVRRLRKAPQIYYDGPPPSTEDLPVWPYGLGFNVLLGVAGVAATTARLRTPSKRLAGGVRVA